MISQIQQLLSPFPVLIGVFLPNLLFEVVQNFRKTGFSSPVAVIALSSIDGSFLANLLFGVVWKVKIRSQKINQVVRQDKSHQYGGGAYIRSQKRTILPVFISHGIINSHLLSSMKDLFCTTPLQFNAGCMITKVKQLSTQSLSRWVTAWEYWVL